MTRRWRMRLRQGIVLLVAVLGLARSVGAAEPVTIEYWHINSPTFGGPAAKELVQLFEARHPDIKVVEKFQPGVYTGLMQQLQVSLAARRPPAVAQIGYNLTAYAAGQFPHVLLDKYRKSDPAFFKGIPDNIMALGVLGGTLHGIPFGVSTPVMYYNADLFKAAGLNPDQPPQTWDDLQRQGAIIKQKTGKLAVYLQQPNDEWIDQTLIWGNGGRPLSEDGKRVGWDAPEAVEAMQMWQDMVNKSKIAANLTWEEGLQAFLSGHVAMCLTTIGRQEHMRRNASGFQVRAVPVPRFGSKPLATATGGNVLMIFASDPAQEKAAWEWIKFVLSPEGATIWTKGTGYLPPRAELANDPRYLKPFFDEAPLMKAALQTFPYARPWVSFPGPRGLEITKILIKARDEVLEGKRPAEPILKEAAQQANALLPK
ncbi:MAG: ABC transporter substrate-binding protein [Candidatus Rokuibacteriota bacterium]|nr:MAG: ABC transporter substrate-binding protein [Candidatus Rokubacteria bacterium]